MSDHPGKHEDVLQALLSGDIDRESAVVQEQLNSCSVCREKVAGLLGLEGAMNQIADEAEELAFLAFEEAPEGILEEKAVDSFRDQLQESEATAPRPLSFSSSWVALAAGLGAVGITIFLIFFLGDPGKENDPLAPGVLGAGQLECLFPSGKVASYDRFEWTHEVEGVVRYSLRIYDRESGDRESGEPALGPLSLSEEVWIPTQEELLSLPAEIHWKVVAFNITGIEVGVDSANASLSSP